MLNSESKNYILNNCKTTKPNDLELMIMRGLFAAKCEFKTPIFAGKGITQLRIVRVGKRLFKFKFEHCGNMNIRYDIANIEEVNEDELSMRKKI